MKIQSKSFIYSHFKGSEFSGAVSCCTLYLSLLKESKKRMPLPSGLGFRLIIRHYGFLSSTWKRAKLQLLQEKLQVKVLEKAEKKPFLPKCPCCKTGNLHRIAVFDQRGPPAWYLGGSQNSSSCES